MLANGTPNTYTASKQLIAGSDFNNVVNQLNSQEQGITATAAGVKANARQLNSAINTLSVVATAADSVMLPKGSPGLEVWIINDGAQSAQVFGRDSDTISDVATATGVAQAAAAITIYKVNKYNPTTKIANWIVK